MQYQVWVTTNDERSERCAGRYSEDRKMEVDEGGCLWVKDIDGMVWAVFPKGGWLRVSFCQDR